MSEPRWISRQDVEFIHDGVIEIGGGARGLRDPSLLESALARPQNLYAYGEVDTFHLAASYAEGISRNHAFVDGNKRTAFQTAYQFLKDNGHQLIKARGVEHAEMMEQLGQGKITREEAATHLRTHSQQLERGSVEKAPNNRDRDIPQSYVSPEPQPMARGSLKARTTKDKGKSRGRD